MPTSTAEIRSYEGAKRVETAARKARPATRISANWPSRRFVLRLVDIALSLFAIVFLSPMFVIVAILIKLDDKGPIFFVQPRVGRVGQEFMCLKFRTMRCGSDEVLRRYLEAYPDEARQWAEYRKLKNDPRITTLGALLRKTSLDEFPQLVNVLFGQMSMVGPRPIMRDEMQKYGKSFRTYASVLPGISGLWQISGRNNLTYAKRVALDRLFVRRRSIRMYLYILVMTIPAVLFQRGSR